MILGRSEEKTLTHLCGKIAFHMRICLRGSNYFDVYFHACSVR